MATIVAALAASHGPLIAREWANLQPANRERLAAGYSELGRRLTEAKVDVIIEISPDHWVNFFLDNLPTLCIGVGEEHDQPPEPFLKPYIGPALRGHPALGLHLHRTAIASGFDPAASHRMRLDHGFFIPLWRMGLLAHLPPIVPIVINALEPPMPSFARCHDWGRFLRQAVTSFPEPLRVAVLASGGLSHSIGEATMGVIDEPFDRACIEHFNAGDDAKLLRFLEDRAPGAGNGTSELRNWICAHGAAGGAFELIDYLPVPEVYVGCGFGWWQVKAA